MITILIIVISIVLLFFLYHFISKKNTLKLTGGAIDITKDDLQIKQPVALITDDIFKILNEDPTNIWYYTEKTDGERALLTCKNGNVYNNDELLDFTLPFKTFYILDTEFYNNKYYIFDVYYKNEFPTYNQPFSKRLEIIKQISNSHFVIKDFVRIDGDKTNRRQHLENAFKIVSTGESKTKNKIDGVIVQNNKPINWATMLKWKRRELTTNDFYLKYIPENKVFYLYVISSMFPHFRNIDDKENLEISLEDENKKLKPITSPFINEIHVFNPFDKWNKNNYTQSEIKQIEKILKDIQNEPLKFDEVIVEMSFTNNNKWVPFRIRKDKMYPNSYKTVFINFQVLFDYPVFPIPKDIYYESINENSQTSKIVHNISHNMRNELFKHLSNHTKAKSVLDLGCGRGGDFQYLVDFGFNVIFGVDNSHNCAKYARRAERCITKEQTLNLIQAYITNDNKDLIKEIKSRNEFPNTGFELILMDFVIHYMLEFKNGLEKLRELILELSTKNALFVFTAFDGNKMIEDARKTENNTLHFGEYEVKITSVENEPGEYKAEMLLPTISENKRVERLFTTEHLNKMNVEILEEFYPYLNIDNSPGLYQYYSYLKAYFVLFKLNA